MLESPQGLPSRYRLVRLLGRGGQARTYLAEDEHTSRTVAVKVFELRDAHSWKGYDLFERECRVLRSLQHPHVVRYCEHGGNEDAGVFYLVMEYASGPTLQERMAQGMRFTDDELERVLRELLQTLGYLHSLNPPVFHRDIKPANVVLTEDAGVKIVDFGGVRDVFSDRGKSTVVGTFGYMAPEQLRGEASPASDLYGLGATIAAVATGTEAAELPHAGLELDLEQCIKPGPVRAALARMLRADPRERVSSARDVEAILDGTRPPPRSPSSPPPVSRDPLQEIERLAGEGQTIAAIRRYREVTGASLPEARQAVHALSPPTRRASSKLARLAAEDRRHVNTIAAVPAAGLLVVSIALGQPGLAALALVVFLSLRFFVGNVFRGYRSPH